MGDTSPLVETEDDIQWRTDILYAIELERWDDAQILLLKRKTRIAEAGIRLLKERDSAIDAWKRKLHELPDPDYIRLVGEVQGTTIGYVKRAIVRPYLASLRRFLNVFKDILVKFVAAIFVAAVAAIAHHIIGAQIDRALGDWRWQYAALVGFILAYNAIEKPLERALDKGAAAIRQWGLRAEAWDVYIEAIMIEAEISSLRDFGKGAT
jgi:hypothetical protein